MRNIVLGDLERLKSARLEGRALDAAIANTIGGTCVALGLWRFFSHQHPTGGVERWNDESGLKSAWTSFLPKEMHCFGEDVFGNQLVLVRGHDNAFLWSHEDAEMCDLFVGPVELIETVVSSGIQWIDFYGDGSLDVAASFGLPPIDSHLHWTMPRILGGGASLDNLSVVERTSHLVGHGKLWAQVRNVDPGTSIVPR